MLFFRFGFFSSGTLLIAQSNNEGQVKNLTGSLTIITICIGIVYAAFILVLSFFIDGIFKTSIDQILRQVSPLMIVMPFIFLVNSAGIGANKIERMSLINVLPRVFYIMASLVILRFFAVEPRHFIVLHVLSTIVGVLVVINLFHPLFSSIGENLKVLWNKTKEYGIHVYQGEIANQTTYHLDGIFITYFVNTTQLGYYTLAMTITSPMHLLSRALFLSLFRNFTEAERIPRKVMIYNFLWLVSCIVGLALLGKYIVVLLFSEKFLPTTRLIPPLAVAAFFQGMYQPYGFISAKGKGKWVRNVAQAEAVSNVIGNIFLIYFFGAFGAAVASAISKFIHWTMLRHYYYRYLREREGGR